MPLVRTICQDHHPKPPDRSANRSLTASVDARAGRVRTQSAWQGRPRKGPRGRGELLQCRHGDDVGAHPRAGAGGRTLALSLSRLPRAAQVGCGGQGVVVERAHVFGVVPA